MKKSLAVSIVFLSAILLFACKEEGYRIKNEKIYFNGEKVISKQVCIDNDFYKTNSEGIIIKNSWTEIVVSGGLIERAYCSEDGKFAKGEILVIEGNNYAFDDDCCLITNGVAKFNGKNHVFINGEIARGENYRVAGGENKKLFFDGEEVENMPEGFKIIQAYEDTTSVIREYIIENKKVVYNEINNSSNQEAKRYYKCSNGDRYYLDDDGKMVKCRYRELTENDIDKILITIKVEKESNYRSIYGDTRYIVTQAISYITDEGKQYLDIESVNFDAYLYGENYYNIELNKTFDTNINLGTNGGTGTTELGSSASITKINSIHGKYYMKPGELTSEEIIEKKTEEALSYKTLSEYDEFTTVDDIESIKMGSYYDLYLGKYDNRFNLEWMILDKNEDELMLLSKYTFNCQRPFGNSELERDEQYKEANIPWEKTNMNDFLNNEFYNNAFSEEEKQRIIEKGDKVSLLSSEEYSKYFIDKEKGKTRPYMKSVYDENWDKFMLKDSLIYSKADRRKGEIWNHKGKSVKRGEIVVDNGIYLGSPLCRPVIYIRTK